MDKKIGAAIKRIRKSKKYKGKRISQGMIGQWTGLHQTAICRIEKGQQTLALRDAFLLAERLGVSVEELRR